MDKGIGIEPGEHSILIVDDEAPVLGMLGSFLSGCGYRVELASCVSDALTKTASADFDVIVSDINMPGMTGLELLRRIKDIKNRPDFILITGLPDFRVAVEAIKEGARDYLPKPLDLENLALKIRNILLDRKHGRHPLQDSFGVDFARSGYSLIKPIGKGGGGTVLLVEKNSIYYAMKIMNNSGLESDHLLRKRFFREIDTLKSLSHESVVEVFEIGGIDDNDAIPYFVMEYVHGATLSSYIKRNCLSIEDRFSVLMQIASALDFIHSRKILHRDIKPENVLLSEDIHVKLTDFGISKSLDPSLTITDTLNGSPHYIAPEIFEYGAERNIKSEIFAFGVLAYELFTGEKPFIGSGLHAVIENIKTAKPHAPSRLNPQVPLWLDDVLARMLDKNPKNRFASLSEGAKMIDNCLSNPDSCKLAYSLPKKLFGNLFSKNSVWKQKE